MRCTRCCAAGAGDAIPARPRSGVPTTSGMTATDNAGVSGFLRGPNSSGTRRCTMNRTSKCAGRPHRTTAISSTGADADARIGRRTHRWPVSCCGNRGAAPSVDYPSGTMTAWKCTMLSAQPMGGQTWTAMCKRSMSTAMTNSLLSLLPSRRGLHVKDGHHEEPCNSKGLRTVLQGGGGRRRPPPTQSMR